MLRVKKYSLSIVSIVISLLLIVNNSWSQCAMCKGTAEKSLEESSTAALGLNMGILYLFIMPYILFMIIGYIWYKNFYKRSI